MIEDWRVRFFLGRFGEVRLKWIDLLALFFVVLWAGLMVLGFYSLARMMLSASVGTFALGVVNLSE